MSVKQIEILLALPLIGLRALAPSLCAIESRPSHYPEPPTGTTQVNPSLENSHLNWSTPERIADLRAKTPPGSVRPDLGTLDAALDESGGLHAFWAQPLVPNHPNGESIPIRHWLLSGFGWIPMPPVKTQHRPVRTFRAVQGQDGRIYLLWVEEMDYYPNYRPEQLYVRRWEGDVWACPMLVSDQKAELSVLEQDQIDLLADKDGGLDVFWIDWRETHFWADLLTMGHAGQFPKIFHRRWFDDHWTEVQKVQRRGGFDVHSMGALLDNHQRIHLFWSQSHWLEYAGVFHSSYEGGQWEKPDLLGDFRDYDGKPAFVDWPQAAVSSDGSIYLAWIWQRWANQSIAETKLGVRTLSRGDWSEPIEISNQVIHFSWASTPHGVTGLAFQEYSQEFGMKDPHPAHPIFYLPIVGGRFGTRQLVTEDAVDGLFNVLVGDDGVHHVVYLTVGCEDHFYISHRQTN